MVGDGFNVGIVLNILPGFDAAQAKKESNRNGYSSSSCDSDDEEELRPLVERVLKFPVQSNTISPSLPGVAVHSNQFCASSEDEPMRGQLLSSVDTERFLSGWTDFTVIGCCVV